ncbi:MAG: aminoglycoside phosphotransferase family protein [Candidatus Limnocylindrales bacterium]
MAEVTDPPPRVVTLVLSTPDGAVLGRLPSFVAATPWWQDAGPVVRAARERFGLELTVLRLLESERPSAHGGAVTYLPEVDPDATRSGVLAGHEPWPGDHADHPQRQSWARPGGPAADLAWATSVLDARGLVRIGPPEQVRSWNLSSLWRLPTVDGAAWLKVVPPFFAHEGAILERLETATVPQLLGHDGARLLLVGIVGEDQYDAALPELHAMVEILVGIQHPWLGRADELLGIGLPDWRARGLSGAIAAAVDRAGSRLQRDDRATLAAFVDGLPARFERIAACGLDDGLVHGDFHPGNVRGDGQALVLLDWGDCGVGHPLLDMPAFLDRIGSADVGPVHDRWLGRWRDLVPGSDPEQAAVLLAPVAAARQAVIYQGFLDRIEPSERPYHQADVPDWLGRTARLARAER